MTRLFLLLLTLLISLSGPAMGEYSDFERSSLAAESRGGLVIGKLDDLENPTGWRTGDHTLHLPPRPPGPGRWEQNARELQHAIDKGQPIRDISPTKGGGFLERERGLLQQNGWKFDPQTGLWSPGG